MTWLTNSVTFVRCDSPKHPGDPIIKIETGYMNTARFALKSRAWSYDHAAGRHVCPDCAARTIDRLHRVN